MSIKQDKNFPRTTSQSVTDLVKRSSIVPDLFSSAIILIVKAGMKKKSVQYATEKNGWRVACPIKKISEPNSHVKKPLSPRKTTSNI